MKKLLILFILFPFLLRAQGLKVNDSTYLVPQADWVPQLIQLEDSVKTFRVVGKGLYVVFEMPKKDVEYLVEIRTKPYVVPPIGNPKPDLIQEIDNYPSASVVYAGAGWGHAVGSKDCTGGACWYKETFSYNPATNATITVTWTGYKIEWLTETRFNQGIVAVSVDGGSEEMIDLYADNVKKQSLVFTKTFPTNGTHTLKLRATGTKNSKSSGANLIHDVCRVYVKQ